MRSTFSLTIAACGLALSPASPSQEERYQNPVDKETYVAPGGWQTYTPDGGVKPTDEKVSLDLVRLLQSQDEIASRTTATELAAFIDRAHKAAIETFAAYAKPAVLMVQFTCVPKECTARIAYQDDPPQELLQTYYDKLKRLEPLRTSGEVKFQFTLKVRP
jgi:hypothetical protein